MSLTLSDKQCYCKLFRSILYNRKSSHLRLEIGLDEQTSLNDFFAKSTYKSFISSYPARIISL